MQDQSTVTPPTYDMKLELVPIPVADLDRAKAFYSQKLGFHVDHDTQPSDTVRVIQLTPPGSGCSIVIGMGMGEISEVKPGIIKGLHLVVKDIRAVRQLLADRGVEMGELIEYPGGIKFVGFSDPDGNSWLLQEIPNKL
ncbi:MAG: VOC family protein [Chloroflexota bacterium]|nr:VOC family protein [Chloroflexota bacterium]